MQSISRIFNLIVIDRWLWIAHNESSLLQFLFGARRSPSVPPDGGKVRTPNPVRKEAPTENLELRDLLDRILDRGLYLGSDVLLLSESTFSAAETHISVGSLQGDDATGAKRTMPSETQPRRRK